MLTESQAYRREPMVPISPKRDLLPPRFLVKRVNLPFLATKPSLRRVLMAFLPAACFFLETMRPARVFMRCFLKRPPEVCLAVPWKTSALVPVAFLKPPPSIRGHPSRRFLRVTAIFEFFYFLGRQKRWRLFRIPNI